jgi:hypothetical protein
VLEHLLSKHKALSLNPSIPPSRLQIIATIIIVLFLEGLLPGGQCAKHALHLICSLYLSYREEFCT